MKGFPGQELMGSLIFTCLRHAAAHLGETGLDPLQLLPVFFAAHDQREQVFLRGKSRRACETWMDGADILLALGKTPGGTAGIDRGSAQPSALVSQQPTSWRPQAGHSATAPCRPRSPATGAHRLGPLTLQAAQSNKASGH